MPYTMEITQRTISPYAEECLFKDEDGHSADGTGPDCTGDCRWMDGDVREIRDFGTFTAEMDADDMEFYKNPVAWAAHYLSGYHPDASEASTGPLGTFDAAWQGEIASGVWLMGETEEDAYNPEIRRETTVYLTGDFTPSQRAQVFALAALSYQEMVRELRERIGQ